MEKQEMVRMEILDPSDNESETNISDSQEKSTYDVNDHSEQMEQPQLDNLAAEITQNETDRETEKDNFKISAAVEKLDETIETTLDVIATIPENECAYNDIEQRRRSIDVKGEQIVLVESLSQRNLELQRTIIQLEAHLEQTSQAAKFKIMQESTNAKTLIKLHHENEQLAEALMKSEKMKRKFEAEVSILRLRQDALMGILKTLIENHID
ncbi:uncharacterized protein LOC134856948 isoform X1 [Symsagittifera roscoffensis]|uniref:uncharacterized protein LOC134856948 isoform X1 n=1 Tax=Symsagittifera roscoffensis TaxID=84072 RepID=UPI00307BBCBC